MTDKHTKNEWVTFRKADGSVARGQIVYVIHTGDKTGYLVRVGNEVGGYLITDNAIVDPEQAAADAAAELRLIHENNRKRSDLLSELLGRLAHYAQGDGRITYHSEYREDWHEELVRDLVDEFTTRRDAS